MRDVKWVRARRSHQRGGFWNERTLRLRSAGQWDGIGFVDGRETLRLRSAGQWDGIGFVDGRDTLRLRSAGQGNLLNLFI